MRIWFAALIFLFAHAAVAVPVKWEFQNAVVDVDGAAVTGYFIYDADLPATVCDLGAGLPTDAGVDPATQCYAPGAFSEFNIHIAETTLGFPGVAYAEDFDSATATVQDFDTNGELVVSNAESLWLESGSFDYWGECLSGEPADCVRFLQLGWDGVLTNAGGAVSLRPYASYLFVSDPAAFNPNIDFRSLSISGSLVGTVVPLPPAVWLFGSAVAGLAALRKQAVQK